jgi:charged multivesicular body protein 2A
MGFTEVFSRKKEVTLTLEEQQKENKQLIRKACRELNREKNALERQEKKTVMDIKAAAKKGQMGSVKIMAKDLVRNRKYQAKFMEMQSNLQGVQLKMRAMNSSQQMAQAMSGVTKAMKMTTKNMDIQGINQMMMEFQRESEKMNLMGDMVRYKIFIFTCKFITKFIF